ncbi:MAG: LPS export ABC transporter periplasmic protein LptC [Cyanobacteria bacterium P01_G01_bin.19]
MHTVKNCLKLQLSLLLAIACTSCQSSSPVATTTTPMESRVDTRLVLNNAVLEQSNKQENTVWKIKADNIVYSEDKKTAVLDRVVGNLLQNGEIILKISSGKGEIRDNGNIVILEDRIVASDPRNGSVMRSNSIEWRPQENLLLIKDKLNAVHPKLEVNASQGKYYTNTEILEIEGDVSADTAEPTARLKSDRLLWQIQQNLVTSPNPIKVVRYNRDRKVTERLTSDRAELDLLAQTATLNGNIELISLEPKIQAASESLVWNYQQRVGKTDSPIQIVDRERQITVTGNRGELDLPQQIATLKQGAKGINQAQPSQLYANQLMWRIDTETIEALGNVIYEQTDPPARLTGEKAIGTLGNNNITVTSNGKQQVTSIIDR